MAKHRSSGQHPSQSARGLSEATPGQEDACREVREALRQWLDAFDAIRDPIFMHDREFRILRANRAYAARAGVPPETFVGKPYWEIFPKGSAPLPACALALSKAPASELADEITTESGEMFHSRTFAVRGPQGEYLHSVHIMENVTERRRMTAALQQTERQYRQMVETSQEGIWVVNAQGQTTYVNPQMAGMLGQTEAEVLGRPFTDLLEGESRVRAQKCFTQCLQGEGLKSRAASAKCFRRCLGGRGQHYDLRLTRKDGSALWAMASASPMFDDMGNFLGLLGMLVDVTERKRAEERLRLAAEVFNSTAESIVILDADRTVVEVNRAFTTVTGYAPLEVAGRKPWQTWLQDKAFFDEAMATLATQDHWRGETHNRRKAGDIYPELLNVSVVRDGSGKPAHYILVCSDITDLKSSQERLEYLASHDRLTGLPNRGLFYDRLQHGLQKAMRRRESLAVMFVDLDNFKIINDTLGHEMGDLLLGQVADRLRSCTRKGDTVARLGGDEFTVLAEDLQEPEDVVSATARRIIDTLSQPFNLDGHEVLTSASVGISLYPENGENLSTLLKNADTAMYRAKQEGKNNFQFFTVDMNVHANERAILEKGLRLALENGEMFLTYQPQVETGTGRVVGLEALLRWRHPGLGLVPPEKFIPVAESSGLIVPIGEWVLDTVCRQVRTWTWQGLDRFRVAVNLSFRQFRQKDLAEAIRGTIGERGIDPANLEIELTESSVMEDADQAGRVLRQLKDMGVRIAIDDFGMGYSSLNYLKRLPIDRLKIDSHFTRDIASNPDDAAIATAIITMGHSMQMAVVAEGVETREQMDFLRARSCDFVQGFYVGRPLPAKEAAETLRLASL